MHTDIIRLWIRLFKARKLIFFSPLIQSSSIWDSILSLSTVASKGSSPYNHNLLKTLRFGLGRKICVKLTKNTYVPNSTVPIKLKKKKNNNKVFIHRSDELSVRMPN